MDYILVIYGLYTGLIQIIILNRDNKLRIWSVSKAYYVFFGVNIYKNELVTRIFSCY